MFWSREKLWTLKKRSTRGLPHRHKGSIGELFISATWQGKAYLFSPDGLLAGFTFPLSINSECLKLPCWSAKLTCWKRVPLISLPFPSAKKTRGLSNMAQIQGPESNPIPTSIILKRNHLVAWQLWLIPKVQPAFSPRWLWGQLPFGGRLESDLKLKNSTLPRC